MSAFIVSVATMDAVVDLISAHQARAHRYVFGDVLLTADEAETRLGRRLYALNEIAIDARYPGETRDTHKFSGSYRFAMPCGTSSKAACVKQIDCLIYQCSEGDIPETSDDYKALVAIRDEIYDEIVSALPDYEAAPWGIEK